MKGFTRNNPYFSLCGLNCKLCSMHLSGHCGGCGFGNQSCPIARCSLEHGRPEYCFQCPEYNDGRKKTLFCLAVNLLPLEELRTVFEGDDMEIPVKERAKLMEKRLKERSSVELKLRRKQ